MMALAEVTDEVFAERHFAKQSRQKRIKSFVPHNNSTRNLNPLLRFNPKDVVVFLRVCLELEFQ